MRLAPLALFLVACGGGSTCDLDAVGDGQLSGTVDGSAWSTSGASWSETGDGIQLVTDAGGGYRMTVSALQTVDGTPVGTAIADGAFPIDVDFGDETAGFGLLYPDGEGSLTTKGGGGGSLTIDAVEGGVLSACIALDVTGDRDASVDAALRATAL